MNIQSFIDDLLAGKGASYSLSFGKPTSGNFASILGYERKCSVSSNFIRLKAELKREQIAEHVRQYLVDNGSLLNDPENYIGGWWHNGELVLDISRRFDTIAEAAEFGIHNRQLAIYSMDLDETIELPEPQDAGTETQKATYARMAAAKIAEQYIQA